MSSVDTRKFTNKFPIHFDNPMDMILFFDPKLNNGDDILNEKQIAILLDFASPASTKDPVQMAVRANNGAGKSKFCLAPCVVWMLISFDFSLSVVTSASAYQLDTQTERYAVFLANKINAFCKENYGMPEVLTIIKRRITCTLTNSIADFFATDQSQKAEGKHPLESDAEMAIFVDEGKSIEEDIYDALDRCTGYTRRLDVSSPGNVRGHFYDICTRKELGWKEYVITAMDCPHIPKESIVKRIKQHGLNDPLIKSSIFADFTSTEEQTVLAYEILLQSIKYWDQLESDGKSLYLPIGKRAGLDLSRGGDETVFSVWDGNKQIDQICFSYKDTTNTTKEVIGLIQKYQLRGPDGKCMVYADDGGVGGGIIDQLKEKGYEVHRVLNQWRAFDNTRYANRGTEMWFTFKRFIEEFQCRPLNDAMLLSQLSNRYYRRMDATGRIALESKEKAKANGHPSPDRADAAVLAWFPYTFPLDLIALGITKPVDQFAGDRMSENQLIETFRMNARKSILEGSSKATMYASRFNGKREITQDDVIQHMDKTEQSISRLQSMLRRGATKDNN